LTDDRTRPVAVILTPGQSGDNPQLEPLLDLHQQQYPAAHRPRFRLLGDKAYSHPSTREKLRGRRISHTIPERQDQKDRRKAKGSKGGRPPGFDQRSTPNATPLSVATYVSSSGAASPPGTTNTP
jgi:putative transposase